MIIKINSGGGNLANYLLYGNKNSRDTNKIKILDGNAKLTDSISKSIGTKDKHFHFIISANGKRSDDDMLSIYKDFKKELLYSYSKKEINTFAVLHQDTDNSHIHIQIPKKNLQTNTKLDLYFHKRDLKRFATLSDYLNLKHLEKPPQTPSKANPSKNWKYNPWVIKTKKEKLAFENMLLDNLFANRDKFNSHEELMKYIKDNLKVDVQKVGYDYKKDDFYITINHTDTNKSQRVFSPLFNNGTSKYITNKAGEKEYIQYDFSTTPLEKQREVKHQENLETLRAKLDKMQEIEKRRIDKRLGRMKKIDTPIKSDFTISIDDTTQIPSPKIEYKDIKKESSLQDTATHYQVLEELKKYNLADILTQQYNYSFIQREDSFDVVENEKNEKLLIYKEKESDSYKYINPYNKKDRGDIATLLCKISDKPLLTTVVLLMNPLKGMLSIFKDLLSLSEILLDLTIETLLEKDSATHKHSIEFKKRKTPSIKGADLKPF